jgi:hypothetical protein
LEFQDPSKAYRARLQICSCVIHISQAVDGTSLPSDLKVKFGFVAHLDLVFSTGIFVDVLEY